VPPGSNILAVGQNPERDAEDTEHDGGDAGHPDLFALGNVVALDQTGIDVVRERR